jgi:hypothetical protein
VPCRLPAATAPGSRRLVSYWKVHRNHSAFALQFDKTLRVCKGQARVCITSGALKKPLSINFRIAVPKVKRYFRRSKRFMEGISRRSDILTVYFDADEGSAYKIDTVVDTLNAIRELYGCFSLLCYGKEPDKHQSTVCFKTGSLEIIYGFFTGVVTAGVCVPILSPTFTELGNQLRDWLFGKTPPQEDNIPPSQTMQKWLESPSESNIKLLTELTDLSRNLKDLNRTVPQITDVLQKTVDNTNTCCRRWYSEPRIRNVRINDGTKIRRENFRERLLSLNKNTVTRYDTQLKIIRPALVEKNKNDKKVSWYLEESNQETFAYFIENDEFQRKISNGEYRNFMQEGALIVARIKISKRGKQTERFVTNVFEMKCNEKTLSLEQKPSDFPLLRQETEEENSKADLERHQPKLF